MALAGITNLPFQSAIIIDIVVDIVFASTSICDELFQLRLHFLDQFLLFNTHGENDLSCNYNVHRGAVRDLGDINPRH